MTRGSVGIRFKEYEHEVVCTALIENQELEVGRVQKVFLGDPGSPTHAFWMKAMQSLLNEVVKSATGKVLVFNKFVPDET